MSAEILGLQETISAIKAIPLVIDREKAFADVAGQFKARLTDATPIGYSGKLKKSVIAQVDDEEAIVGYEEGVETAGNPKLDSVTRPRTRGRSVLWVSAESLEELLAQEFEDFEGTAVSVLEELFAEQINAGT